MREIKFRAWDKQHSKWVTEPLGFTMSVVDGRFHIFGFNESFADIKQEQVKLMQYTGLTDRNGVEIYEGDIVASGRFTEGVVKYDECSGGGPDESFSTMGFYVNDKYDEEKGLFDIDNIEVIGNIYENPELVK